MKIVSQEMLFLNNNRNRLISKRNVGFANSPIPQDEPETSINALSARARHNVTFQGINVQAVKKPVYKAMIALAILAGGAALSQSCDKPQVTVNQSVSVDMSTINQMYQQMLEYYKLMLEQQKISNEQYAQTNAYLQQLLLEVQKGNMTMAEFKEAVLTHFVTVETNQETLIKQLEDQGKTQEEIKALLEPFYEAYNKGDFETAWKYYLEIMNSINGHVANIDATLSQFAADFNKFAKSFEEHKTITYMQLAHLNFTNGLEAQALLRIGKDIKSMKSDLSAMRENSDELLEMTETNHAEVIAYLTKIADGQIREEDLELMFKTMGITISEAIEMSKDELIAAIKKFQRVYIKTEANQTEQLENINNKLDVLAAFPGLSTDELTEALKGIEDAVNNNTEVLGGKLDNIDAQLGIVNEKLDNIFDEVVDFHADYHNTSSVFMEKFDNTTNSIGEVKVAIEAFMLMQDKDNADLLKAINKTTAKQSQSNTYLKLLLNKTDKGNEILNEIKRYAKNGLTKSELEEVLKKRDEENHTKYFETLETMLSEFGLDDIGDDLDVIAALLDSINAKADGITTVNTNLEEFLAAFKTFVGDKVYEKYDDAQLQAKMAQILEAIENLEFECNCVCNNNHEGTDQPGGGNLDDIFG